MWRPGVQLLWPTEAGSMSGLGAGDSDISALLISPTPDTHLTCVRIRLLLLKFGSWSRRAGLVVAALTHASTE